MTSPDSLLRRLFQAARAITRDLNAELESEGLFSAEWAILSLLHGAGPASQAALAAGLSIEPPAISKALARLEAKGLVSRGEGPNRRENRVALSPVAEARFALWAERAGAHHARVLAGLTPAETEQLHALLSRLYANVRPGAGDL
ncbi:MAG: MarR family transcriptional regulator [Chthoniobacter sp.]|nr:MarR family transcriptional regulator [Chthoniobacter sp.]